MTSYPMSSGAAAAFTTSIGGTPTKEGEIGVIRSLHAADEAGAAPVCYGFSGVTMASSLEGVARGDRFQGQFQCSGGLLEGDGADAVVDDPAASLALVIGPHRLISAGALSIQRLVTPQFYRIAIRCRQFANAPGAVKRVNLAFYSDPRYCADEDFRLDRLDIDKIPMPSLYVEAEDGQPAINAKLQCLTRLSGPLPHPSET